MEWVLNNLENVIIPIIIMILYGLGSVGQKKKKEGKQGPGRQQPQADPDEARRVREIQEEIRRKIAERSGRVPPPVPTREPTATKPVPQVETRRFPTPSRQPSRRPEPVPSPPPVPSYQDELKAKMRQVKALEAQAAAKLKATDAYVIKTAARRKVNPSELRSQLFADLSNPMGQQKAILVSEILGSPVGIKGPAGWKANV